MTSKKQQNKNAITAALKLLEDAEYHLIYDYHEGVMKAGDRVCVDVAMDAIRLALSYLDGVGE